MITTPVLVVGYGWLGKPLVAELNQAGFNALGTSRNPSPNTPCVTLKRTPDGLYCDAQKDQINAAYWVVCVPPGTRKPDSDYLTFLTELMAFADTHNAKGVVLCSSTGIYPDAEGTFTEQTPFELDTPKQRILHAAEALVLSHPKGMWLRLGGLIDEARHPGRFGQTRPLNSAPEDAINMVHQEDVIGAITHVLEQFDAMPKGLNVVAPYHPTKAEYYQAMAASLGNPAPQFTGQGGKARVVSSEALIATGFNFKRPTLTI